MTKNEEQLRGRQKLIAMCINDPKLGAEYLRRAAETLERCKNTEQITKALADILFLSKSTIYKTYYNESFVKTENKALAS